MATERLLVLVGYVLSAALPLLLVSSVYRHRSNSGSTGMFVLVAGIFLWCTSVGALYFSASYTYGLAAANVRLFAVYLTVGGWLLIALEYTDLAKPRPLLLGALLFPAVLVQAIAWAAPELIWAGSTFEWGWEESTSLYTAHVVYNYLVVALALTLFAGDAVSSRGLRRKQGIALFASIVPPVAANALFQVGTDIELDVTPIGLVVSVYVLAWALYRANFLDVVPAGRRRAIEELSDPVITLDDQGRVVDYNRAARKFAGAGTDATGTHFEEFFTPLESIVTAIERSQPDTEVTVQDGATERYFDLTITPITTGNDGGQLVVLRDVTELKERERVLRESEAELELLRQVFERTLRHNIRNDVNVLEGYAQRIQAAANGESVEMAERIAETSQDLADTSRKARTVGRLVDRDSQVAEIDICGALDALIEVVESSYSDVDFQLSCPDETHVEIDPTVQIGLQNLIENAAEHNEGDVQTVEIGVEEVEDGVIVTITDDGPGIPGSELSVIENKEETPLKHGSGLGMWVIYWVDETTGASISFDTGDSGTTATVRIPDQ